MGTHCMAGFLLQMEAEELLNLSHPLLLQLCPCVRAPGLALRFSSVDRFISPRTRGESGMHMCTLSCVKEKTSREL